jgi:hypothetical protein
MSNSFDAQVMLNSQEEKRLHLLFGAGNTHDKVKLNRPNSYEEDEKLLDDPDENEEDL